MKFLYLITNAVLFTLVLLLPNSILAQMEIAYNISVTPKYTTLRYDKEHDDNGGQSFNLSVGGNVDMKFGKFILGTGVNMSSMTFSQLDRTLIFGCVWNPTPNTIQHQSYIRNETRGYYIGIPLDIKYKLDIKKQFYVKVGGELLFYTNETRRSFLKECGAAEIKLETTRGSSSTSLNKTLSKISFGIGYEFAVLQKILFLEPVVEYSLRNINDDNILIFSNAKSLEFGLKLGVIL